MLSHESREIKLYNNIRFETRYKVRLLFTEK